jgi:hypothetical protein
MLVEKFKARRGVARFTFPDQHLAAIAIEVRCVKFIDSCIGLSSGVSSTQCSAKNGSGNNQRNPTLGDINGTEQPQATG